MKNRDLYVVILLLLTIIIWLTKCKECETSTGFTDTITDTSYIHDTIRTKGKTKIKPVPVPFYIHDTIIDSTGHIVVIPIKKYMTPDTFTFNSDSIKVTVYTKIYSNSPLDSINTELKAIIRSKIIETIVTKQEIRKHAFFAGPSIGFGKTSTLTLDGLYERNNKVIYRLGFGVNNNLQPVVKAGVYWQLTK